MSTTPHRPIAVVTGASAWLGELAVLLSEGPGGLREIGLDSLDVSAMRAQVHSDLLERPLIGGQGVVMAILGAKVCQFATDAPTLP